MPDYPVLSHGRPSRFSSLIWEVRIRLDNRIARVLFALDGQTMVLLNGFIKKQQVTPKPDLDLGMV